LIGIFSSSISCEKEKEVMDKKASKNPPFLITLIVESVEELSTNF
jgi:hypothetical protein